MKSRKIAALALTGVMVAISLSGCGASDKKASEASQASSTTDSNKKVLRVGMECAYAPFNWTQDTDTTPDGSKAVKIYDSDYYAYGYDVAVAQMLADQMGMELEIHKVEWSSIGISLDAGDYDAIIAGMGKTAERDASYAFTEPYYYRNNCIVVKKGGKYADVKGLSDLAGTIAGMGKTAERDASYAFTEPYYYRNNCIVVKKGGKYADVKGLSDLAGTGCKVTTQLGTGWISLLDQIEGAEQSGNFETTSECFMAISNGSADVCIVDLPTAESGTGWISLLDQIEGAEQSGNFETTSECFMAISNGSADVCIVDLPTAESAALTNDDLQIIQLDENDGFTGDDEMVNVCIATRKDDTRLRDQIQDAMNAIGWNDKDKMDELMNTVLTQQPAAN